MKILSAVILAVTSSCALVACHSSSAPPRSMEPVRLVKTGADLADLGIAGYLVHPPATSDAPGLIELVDAKRRPIGTMTSATVRSEASVRTTMTIEGLGNAEPLALTDETIGDGTVTRVTIQRGAETSIYEHDAVGTFLVLADRKIAIDAEHEAELSAALMHTSADPRFRVFAALTEEPESDHARGMAWMPHNHKSALCQSVLSGAVSACITICMAAATPALPITLPACLLTCGVAAVDFVYCQYQASTAVNDAQCDQYTAPGYIGRADATEHQCLRQCDQSRCDGFCRNPPQSAQGGYCSSNYCTCAYNEDDGDGFGDYGGGGGGGGGDYGGGGPGPGGGGSCAWCDCTSEFDEYHGAVCGETLLEIVDGCWNSCG